MITKDYLWTMHNPLFYLRKHKTPINVLCFRSHALCLLLPADPELSRRTNVNFEIEDSYDKWLIILLLGVLKLVIIKVGREKVVLTEC